MTQEELKLLTESANRFYMNRYSDSSIKTISDKQYDELARRYREETGLSEKTLVQWDSDLKLVNDPDEGLAKEIVENEDMVKVITQLMDTNGEGCVAELKYDGSSIKGYYTPEGRLAKVLGTPDEAYGIDRTKAFFDIFPKRVKPGIKTIRGEVLVDANKYGKLARNKANGLTNSKHMDDEVNREAFVRAYQLKYWDNRPYDFEEVQKDLDELPKVTSVRDGKEVFVFDRAYKLTKELIPTSDIVHLPNGEVVQADGVVLYTKQGVRGYKFYYTESDITTVEGIDWTFNSNNGSYAAVLMISQIELNGKNINRVSSNGVPNLVSLKFGIGSQIEVILANMTIPKVHKVLSQSTNYDFPTCECGYKLSENDIFGSALKCQNPNCSTRLANKSEILKWVLHDRQIGGWEGLKTYIECNPFWVMDFIAIDRYNPRNSFIGSSLFDVTGGVINSIENNDEQGFKQKILSNFRFTDLSQSLFEIYYLAAFKALRNVYENCNN